MTDDVDAAALEAAEEMLSPPTEAPQDAARLLLWLDARAEALREVRTRLEQDAAAEKLRRARWEERRAKEEKRAAALELHMRQACEAMRHVLLPGTTKSRTLPSGAVVAFRRRPMALQIVDSAPLRQWAYGLEFIREELDEPAIRAHFRETGEEPPGCKATGGEETFRINTEGE